MALSVAALATSLSACGPNAVPDTPDELPASCAQYVDMGAPGLAADPTYWHAQTVPVLIENGTVFTAAGDVLEDGYVFFENGLVVAVGTGDYDAPTGTTVIDATDQFVTPGIIDTHSHLGVYATPYIEALSDGNEATGAVTAQVEAIDSVWPQDPGFQRAIAGGITTLHILPGSANLVGGQGATIKIHRGAQIGDEMRFVGAPRTVKMACGENPKRVYGDRGGPATRMGSVAAIRQTWIDAISYRESWDEHDEAMTEWCEAGAPNDEEPDAPGIDLGNETLAGVLRGDILPQIHCYRADEMLTQIEVADEFGFSIRSFHHAVEAYKIRDVLAERGIATSTWADWWGFKIEAFDAILENAAMLTESGAIAVIHSDSEIGIQRLNQEAGKAFYAGIHQGIELTEDDAMRWITINAAWVLGIDDVTGSLEPGKMADVVVWDAHPFSVYASATRVFVDGVEEFNLANNDEPWSDFELGLMPEMWQ